MHFRVVKMFVLIALVAIAGLAAIPAAQAQGGIHFSEGTVTYQCDSPNSVTANLVISTEADAVWIAWRLAGPSDFSQNHRADFGSARPGDVLSLTATGLPSGRHTNVHFSATAYRDGQVVGQAGLDINIGWPHNCPPPATNTPTPGPTTPPVNPTPPAPPALPEAKNCPPFGTSLTPGTEVFGRMLNSELQPWDESWHLLGTVSFDGSFAFPFWGQNGVWELQGIGTIMVTTESREFGTEKVCSPFSSTEATIEPPVPTTSCPDCPPSQCGLIEGNFVRIAIGEAEFYWGLASGQITSFPSIEAGREAGLTYWGTECGLCAQGWAVQNGLAWYGPGSTTWDLAVAIAQAEGRDQDILLNRDFEAAFVVSQAWHRAGRPETGDWYSFE